MASKDSFKTGFTKYSLSDNKYDNKKHKDQMDISKGKYPNGVLPFVFITLVFGIILLVGLLTYDPILLKWADIFCIAAGIAFCFSVGWLVLRQKFNVRRRYGMKKMSIKLKLNRFKFTEPYRDEDYSINKVETLDDYSEYLTERSNRSKIMFYICLGLYTVLFIVAIIVDVTV